MSKLDTGLERAQKRAAAAEVDVRTVSASPVLEYLNGLLEEYRTLDEGQVATYIPELGRADPRWFGGSFGGCDVLRAPRSDERAHRYGVSWAGPSAKDARRRQERRRPRGRN